MGSKIGVLVFPAGEINSVELHAALSTCVNIRLYGASSVDRHGRFIFADYISDMPHITSENFITEINKIITEHKIDVVVPAHDDVALFFANNASRINAVILNSDKETAEICRDKKLCYEMFNSQGFCPAVYDDINIFPCFIKPRKGQGAVGARIINNPSDIPADISVDEYVICEYLPGDELTVDCFTDNEGKLLITLPRSRQRVFGGVSVRGQNEVLTDEISCIADTINSRLKFIGLWYFQIKKAVNNKYKLLEISSRCAGTMCLSRALGINLPLLSVYATLGFRTEIIKNAYNVMVDRTLISRYKTDILYDHVYIDYDDTIVINNKVNLQVMRFIYQCVNNKKNISLITRHNAHHDDTVTESLQKHRISLDLFSEIIEPGEKEPKHMYIKKNNSIFIDNSYAERKAVHEKLNIPVFDVDCVEVLLDWRV